MAKLKPWYQVVTPREDLRDNRPLDASEFAIHLDQIRAGRAHKDYTQPDRFFERTHLTGSLLELAAQTLRRLSGIQLETSALFNMSTQFGGGKSHSLTALYHLGKHGERARNWKGVDRILARAGVPAVPDAAVAVFMGKEFDSFQGRGGGDEPVRRTPWGEIAWQLGGAKSFAVIEQHEREFIEPKGDAIRAMLPKDRPVLILMDEIISYASTYRKKGYGDRFYNFLDCLAETARGEKNVAVVVSVPASELEYTTEDVADEARFKKMLDRLGKAIMMSADTDIAGKSDAHGTRLDREANEAIKKAQLHRKVAATIFFESNGGMSQARAEATVPEIKTDVFGPDSNLVDLDNVLESLAGTCYYLSWERNRYRFGLSPNLNQILVNRRGAVPGKAIDERIRQQTQKLFDKHTVEGSRQVDRKYSPMRSNDVPNRAMLTLVVFGLDTPAGEKKTTDLMEVMVRDCGATGRTFKSALIFAVPDGGANMREAARNLLAWEDINDDVDTKKRVDEAQLKLLDRNLASARRDLDEALFRSYRHVYLLGKDNTFRVIDLGQITSSSAGSIVELILRELERNDEVTQGVSPNKLIKYWPPALVEWSTKAARDAFYSSPQLSRLLNPDAIKRTISDGVTQSVLGYASKDGRGKLKLQKFKTSMLDAEVEISEEMFILKAEDPQKLLEPPRLAQLVVRPEHVGLKAGEEAAFSCSALDQYGQPFATPAVTWSVSGGSIRGSIHDGIYTAGATGGLYSVRAEAGGREASAEVRIKVEEDRDNDDDDNRDTTPGKRLIRWQGTVPPQKWMNFYTKVLSRFASAGDLKLAVSFEVEVERDQAQSRADETRSGLKELGLDDGVTLT